MSDKKLIDNLTIDERNQYYAYRRKINNSLSAKEAEGYFEKAKQILAKAKKQNRG